MFPSNKSALCSSMQNTALGDMDPSATSSTQRPEKEGNSSSVNRDELHDFRERWQKEWKIASNKDKDLPATKQKCKNEDKTNQETEAKNLFMKGVEMEKSGKLYEAIQFYKKAIQMVPDIERKIQDVTKTQKGNHSEKFDDHNQTPVASNDSDDDTDECDLLSKIQKKMSGVSTICSQVVEQKHTHFSALPMEIILYILRWVVSSELDLTSLEMFGATCRGFYLCARDSEIWRLACVKVWGMHCGKTPGNFGNWRQMFIDRMRLRFNGCYISKTTYIRHGENNFQDQFYQPWHLVAYYRYLRFFPDNTVLMLTSPDEPPQCVPQLRHKIPRAPVLSGYYRLKDDKVTIVIQHKEHQSLRKNRRDENPKQSYHIEFQIVNQRKKKHMKLHWLYYSITTRTRGEENICIFDLVGNKFPPFWFSKVKSYTNESENSLV